MSNADIILNFARSHDNNFARKEFMTWYSQEFPNGSLGSIDITLQNLVKNGILTRSGYGRFQISSTTKPEFRYAISDTDAKLYSQIKELYPYTHLCIWNTQALSPFMQHVPNVDTLIIETERIAAEPIYEELEALRRYIRETESIEKTHMSLIIASYRFRLVQLCKGFLAQF